MEGREGVVKRGYDDWWEGSYCEGEECGEVGEGACGEWHTCRSVE